MNHWTILILALFALAIIAPLTNVATPEQEARAARRVPKLSARKRWRRRLLSWWSGVTALAFLCAALGVGYIIIRSSIEPGDIARPKDVPGWSDREVSETMTQARRMINACYAYKERNGRFPKTLEDLVPHFLRNVEPPAVGHKSWTYSSYNQGKAFYLSFAANSRLYPGKSYASGRSPPWSLDD